jgi:microcystin-dependent protein
LYSPVPIGAILPFAGDCRDRNVVERLGAAGWVPCDGASLLVNQYPDLYNAIGVAHGGEIVGGAVIRFSLPNLNGGRFARGVNGDRKDPAAKYVDPEADTRETAAPNGNRGNNVGSRQMQATALPRAPFSTDSAGEHTHAGQHVTATTHYAYNGSTRALCAENTKEVTVPQDGAHHHATVSGGDGTTQPVSIAMYHIIKVK